MGDDHQQLPRIPSRAELKEWAVALRADEEVSKEALLDLLAEVRRCTRDLGWFSDFLLVLLRDEHGAGLPALAASWSASGNSLYVRGPDARLKTLYDRYGSLDDVIAALQRLPDAAKGAEEPDAP